MLRRLAHRRRPDGVILLYHRVAKVGSDPWALNVSPEHFAEHLDAVRRYGSCMALTAFVQAWDDGSLPSRAVVVTFDDGYADNLHHAKPLLERIRRSGDNFPEHRIPRAGAGILVG